MRIMIVEDHKATCDEMRTLIEKQPDMHVVAVAESGEAGLVQARAERPDVAVMDIQLPGINGIETTRRILAEQPGVRILALSNLFGDSLVSAILDAGGLGYVQKSRAFEELVPALRKVAAGYRFVSGGRTDRSA